MMNMTRNPFRWILALVLAPVAPFVVLWVASLGREYGELAGSMMVSLMAAEPWMMVAFAALGPGLLVGMLLHLLIHRKPPLIHATTEADSHK
jgi:hypothetical protein